MYMHVHVQVFPMYIHTINMLYVYTTHNFLTCILDTDVIHINTVCLNRQYIVVIKYVYYVNTHT